jgi:outer membrane murein-binding lipoprotein Lpp
MTLEMLEQSDKGKQRGQDMSMRSLISRNNDTMHKVGSRLGDLTALRGALEQAIMLLEGHKEAISSDVQKISNKIGQVERDVIGKITALETKVGGNERAIKALDGKIASEIAVVEGMKKALSDELVKVEGAIKHRLSRQRYLWSGVAVLVLGLVSCLGYLCFEVRELTAKVEKMQVNVDSSMTEIKGNFLGKGTNKAVEVKPASTGKGKSR